MPPPKKQKIDLVIKTKILPYMHPPWLKLNACDTLNLWLLTVSNFNISPRLTAIGIALGDGGKVALIILASTRVVEQSRKQKSRAGSRLGQRPVATGEWRREPYCWDLLLLLVRADYWNWSSRGELLSEQDTCTFVSASEMEETAQMFPTLII